MARRRRRDFAGMPGRIPRSLTKMRNQLAHEGEQMRARLVAVLVELAAPDYALTIIEPGEHHRSRVPVTVRRSS